MYGCSSRHDLFPAKEEDIAAIFFDLRQTLTPMTYFTKNWGTKEGNKGSKRIYYSHALNYFTATGFIFIAISVKSSEFISSYVRLCVSCKAHIIKLNNNDSIRWLLIFFSLKTRPFVARSPKLHEINFALFIYVRPLLLFICWRKAFFCLLLPWFHKRK